MSKTKTINEITQKQISERGVQALSNRPNAASRHGAGGLSSEQLKLWFDKLSIFLAEKINEGNKVLSSDDAASYIRVCMDELGIENLNDLISSFSDGTFSERVLSVYPSAVSSQKVPLQVVLNDMSESISTIMNGEIGGEGVVDWSKIQQVVRSGNASSMFNIGDQIIVKWTHPVNGAIYEMPFDVVHFGTVSISDGSEVPGMYLQSHYCLPFYVAFDAAETAPATGTMQEGVYYYGIDPSTHMNRLLEVPDDYIIGMDVSSLIATFSAIFYNTVCDPSGEISSMGYNNWAESAIRQFLNSEAFDDSWWTPQHDGDVRQISIPAMNMGANFGFLSGFDSDFLGCVGEVRVCTCVQGEESYTFDRFFIPSLEQMYIDSPHSGEGEAFEYWKQATGLENPVGRDEGEQVYIPYGIDAKQTPCSAFLRSEDENSMSRVYYIGTDGMSAVTGASAASKCMPVCVLC